MMSPSASELLHDDVMMHRIKPQIVLLRHYPIISPGNAAPSLMMKAHHAIAGYRRHTKTGYHDMHRVQAALDGNATPS